MRDRIVQAPLESIYHHFYEGILRPSFDDLEYRNDFAVWAHQALRDPHLAERLGQIHPLRFRTLEELREALLDVIEDRLSEHDVVPWAERGREFYFLSAKVVIFDTHARVERPKDLPSVVETLTRSSIYFHFIEAQRRDPVDVDDFSAWLRSWGDAYEPVCKRLSAIDYHFFNLREVREHILEALSLVPKIAEKEERA